MNRSSRILVIAVLCVGDASMVSPGRKSNSIGETDKGPARPAPQHNILHIIADDLRTELPQYGHSEVYAPNIEKLARKGMTFHRAYVQIAVCSPSRMSFLSGRRPETTNVFNFVNHLRQADCGAELINATFVGASNATLLAEPSPLSWDEGGSAQCCTLCTNDSVCGAWTYQRNSADWHTQGNGTCALFALSSESAASASTLFRGGKKAQAAFDRVGSNSNTSSEVRGGNGQATELPFSPGALSGLRGNTESQAGMTTLPQAFKNAGFLTMGTGKVWHTEEGGDGPDPWIGRGLPPNQDPPSWSAYGSTECSANPMACNLGQSQRCAMATNESVCAEQSNCSCIPPMIDQGGCASAKATVGPVLKSACAIDADLDGDNDASGYGFVDRKIAADAEAKISFAAQTFNATGRPFYLAVGFRKTHLSWRFPQPWLDLYGSAGSYDLTAQPTLDTTAPDVSYCDTGGMVAPAELSPWNPMDNATAATYRLYYKACISFLDYNVGRVLSALERSGLSSLTAVVLHSDHGWSLGEDAQWEKFSNREEATRIPLTIYVPWLQPTQPTDSSSFPSTDALVEAVDLYPTLLQLANIPLQADALTAMGDAPTPTHATSLLAATAQPNHHHHHHHHRSFPIGGTSIVPLLTLPSTADASLWGAGKGGEKRGAFSQYPRCPKNEANLWQANHCTNLERCEFPIMGYSVRTRDWRLTLWQRWNGAELAAAWDQLVASELYDMTQMENSTTTGTKNETYDFPGAYTNVVDDPANTGTVTALASLIRGNFR